MPTKKQFEDLEKRVKFLEGELNGILMITTYNTLRTLLKLDVKPETKKADKVVKSSQK